MLRGMRNAGRTWLGKAVVGVLFAFLILSFAVWGINDIFRGAPRNTVATVGGTEITADAFRNAYQGDIQQLMRQTRQSITPQQARAFGLDQQVLSRLVSEAVLDRRAQDLGLGVSDPLLVRSITEDTRFRGPGGFERARLEAFLNERGQTEALFLRDQRGVATRTQLAEAISGSLTVPLAMREAVHRYGSERRTAAYITLPAAGVGDIPATSEDQLKAFYEERKSSFRAPDYRAINVLAVDPASLAKPETVSEADARQRYEQIKDSRFGAAERRTVQQIVFPTLEEAKAAAERIKQGTTLEALAAERNIDSKDLELGTFSKAEMVDPAVADAAFAVSEGAVSEPVQGRFGNVLVRVTAIQPGSVKPFEEVAGEVRREIAADRSRNEITELHDQIEDLRASARPLAEIGKEKGLQLLAIPAVDRQGRDKAGNPVQPLPEREALLPAVFGSDIGVDNEALRTRAGGYVWYEVAGIEPARERSFEETRNEVAAQWRADQVSRSLANRARGLVERLERGETIEAVAAEVGGEAKTATDLARRASRGELSTEVVNRMFSVPVGKAASVEAGDSRVVFKITGASVPPFVTTTAAAASLADQLRNLLTDDLLAQYVAQAQAEMGVAINQQAVSRAVGGEI